MSSPVELPKEEELGSWPERLHKKEEASQAPVFISVLLREDTMGPSASSSCHPTFHTMVEHGPSQINVPYVELPLVEDFVTVMRKITDIKSES